MLLTFEQLRIIRLNVSRPLWFVENDRGWPLLLVFLLRFSSVLLDSILLYSTEKVLQCSLCSSFAFHSFWLRILCMKCFAEVIVMCLSPNFLLQQQALPCPLKMLINIPLHILFSVRFRWGRYCLVEWFRSCHLCGEANFKDIRFWENAVYSARTEIGVFFLVVITGSPTRVAYVALFNRRYRCFRRETVTISAIRDHRLNKFVQQSEIKEIDCVLVVNTSSFFRETE